MSPFFDWIPEDTYSEEIRLAKVSELMSKRARRKIIHERIIWLMAEIQKLECERDEVCDAEERLEDELARRKK